MNFIIKSTYIINKIQLMFIFYPFLWRENAIIDDLISLKNGF